MRLFFTANAVVTALQLMYIIFHYEAHSVWRAASNGNSFLCIQIKRVKGKAFTAMLAAKSNRALYLFIYNFIAQILQIYYCRNFFRKTNQETAVKKWRLVRAQIALTSFFSINIWAYLVQSFGYFWFIRELINSHIRYIHLR